MSQNDRDTNRQNDRDTNLYIRIIRTLANAMDAAYEPGYRGRGGPQDGDDEPPSFHVPRAIQSLRDEEDRAKHSIEHDPVQRQPSTPAVSACVLLDPTSARDAILTLAGVPLAGWRVHANPAAVPLPDTKVSLTFQNGLVIQVKLKDVMRIQQEPAPTSGP